MFPSPPMFVVCNVCMELVVNIPEKNHCRHVRNTNSKVKTECGPDSFGKTAAMMTMARMTFNNCQSHLCVPHVCRHLRAGVFYSGQFRLRPTSFFYSGQFYLGQVLLRPILLMPSSTLGQFYFGPNSKHRPILLVCVWFDSGNVF